MKAIFLALHKLAHSGNIRPGKCPEIPNQPDFNVDKYTGTWYNYLANDVVNVPDNADCVSATYGVLNDRQISVNNTAALIVDIRGNEVPLLSWAYGSATVVNPEYPNQLWVEFEEFGGCGANAVICGGTGSLGMDLPEGPIAENYRVTETDYENYTIVVSCYNKPETNTHSEITYLMTRDRNWGPNNREKVEELLARVKSWGIEIDSLLETDHSDCERFTDVGLIP